ncbi:hypothetical protein DAPPUDRAFT_117688 [Daphnia pulex]|uniref:Uncharacterized protein n=1 Tax=Daphnia pulex TaxID=6669 RepID=E9HTH8_DAPPU|nr:hypothetical protein DAPPUDRAFT_117688 [Daphnia pulex]|eukprot:EFX64958.1 hypothetical protein DAPPUDRAFT_117688 [Daphnia pulex]
MDPMNNGFHPENSVFDTYDRRMSFLDAPLQVPNRWRQQQRAVQPTTTAAPSQHARFTSQTGHAGSSPNNKQQQQQLTTHLLDESKKIDEGKENTEVHLAPPKSSPIINNPAESEMMMLVESNTVDDESLGIDMSDPRTRLRIERFKEERRSSIRPS